MAEIILHEAGITSDVKEAASDLAQFFNEELKDKDGKIWIIPSVDIHTGTGVHDLDMLVMGYLHDLIIDNIAGFDDIEIQSFITTIEVKSHAADGISSEGTKLYVQYPNGEKDVTEQSEKQKETLKRFLGNILQYKIPFVTNIIWLTGINYDDFEQSIGLTNSNIITADATIHEFFSAIGRRYRLKDQGFVNAFSGYTENEIEGIADIFCKKSDGVDTMSLRRINLLYKENTITQDIEKDKNKIVVLSGHAGTGKTIMLLQAANILTKKGKECLFLTYNNALISDLKHTLSYIRNASNIEIQSMHSFMISILYKNRLWGTDCDIQKDFIAKMNILNAKDNIKAQEKKYDYIFVDEAQDWEKPIPEVLKKIFNHSQIVIADGVDQFMESSEHTNWGKPMIPTLRKCLRQRRNLTVFAKIFANKMGVNWNVDPNEELPGGKVIVLEQYTTEKHFELVEHLKEHESCTEYDFMILASNSLVENGKFKHYDAYKENNIPLFDGIDSRNRAQIYGEEDKGKCRVYTYESCRGLEAWTTVCLRFDELFDKPHPHDYKDIHYDMARKHMLTLWSLIPITRAIDTLVLCIAENSSITNILKEIASENPDFVTYKPSSKTSK